MTAKQIVATVTKDPTTAGEVQAVVARLGKALSVMEVEGGIEVGNDGNGSPLLKIKVVADILTVSVKRMHGEKGLWVAAAVAATLGEQLVDANGGIIPANVATVSNLIGQNCTEEGKDLAEKLGVILPRIRGGIKSIKF